MTSKNLEHGLDKKFLKQNDLAKMLGKSSSFVKDYKAPVLLLSVVALLLLVGVPFFKYYRNTRVQDLNTKLFEAGKGLKKEEAYLEIIKNYDSIPASKLANLKLAEYYINNQNPEKALEVIDQGLDGAKPDITATLLTLKKIDVLRSQKKWSEALSVAQTAQVLPTFSSRLKLIEAELLLSQGKAAEAKSIYQALAASAKDVAENQMTADVGYDPDVVNEAKEKLTLIELGLI